MASQDGITLIPGIIGSRIATFKRTPGPYGRVYLSNKPACNQYTWTFVLEKGFSNCWGVLKLYHMGQMYWQDQVKSAHEAVHHPEVDRWLAKIDEHEGGKNNGKRQAV